MNALILPSAAVALKALDRLEVEIANAPTFEALDKIANQAAGMQRAFKPVKDVADRAGEVWIAAEEKLAEELEKQPKAVGTRGQLAGGSKRVPPAAPTLKDKGVDKKRAARAKKLVALSKPKKKAIIQKLKDEGKGVTPAAVLAASRKAAKEEKKHAVQAAVFSADGPFDVVVIDPPWRVEKIDRDVRPNQDAFDYPTMTNDELVAFWRETLAPKLADDCHVFMWTTQKHLRPAMAIIDEIGLRYVLLLFVDTKQFNCCFEAPRREHSRKPDFFYDTIRRVTGGSRIDVFSREPREGFAQFGNEIGRFAA
jgi:N6-adenosine-specific RNA methylase IME4